MPLPTTTVRAVDGGGMPPHLGLHLDLPESEA